MFDKSANHASLVGNTDGRNNVRTLREIKGLKFPDAFVTRWFFKQGLDRRPGRMLELGSGTGNNLALPLAYDWAVTGVDLQSGALADARFNLGDAPKLIEADLSKGLPALDDAPFDAVMIPNLLCYLRTVEAERVLSALVAQLAPNADVFLSTRLIDDHRYAKGEEVEPRTWRLATEETGEAGLINRFYDAGELEALLARTLGLYDIAALHAHFENIQAGGRVANSDLIVWGKAQGRKVGA